VRRTDLGNIGGRETVKQKNIIKKPHVLQNLVYFVSFYFVFLFNHLPSSLFRNLFFILPSPMFLPLV
jgi:hypothetical protein